MFIHDGKSAEVSVVPTNQIVDAEVSHAPDLVEAKQHGRLETRVWRKANRMWETNASAVGQPSWRLQAGILHTGFLLQCFDTVGWVIWPVKTRPWYDLQCVWWNVKPSSINTCCSVMYDKTQAFSRGDTLSHLVVLSDESGFNTRQHIPVARILAAPIITCCKYSQ